MSGESKERILERAIHGEKEVWVFKGALLSFFTRPLIVRIYTSGVIGLGIRV